MKRLTLFLLFLTVMGCQKKGVESSITPGLTDPDLLYRTWELTKIVTDGQLQDNSQPTTVTFPRDGNIRGNQPDGINWCCKPSRFEVSGNTLRFMFQTASSCAAVFCGVSPLRGDVVWQITILTETSLVLTSGKYRLEFATKP